MSKCLNSLRTDQQNSHHSSADMTTGRSRLETYVANPPLIPLVQASNAANILVVQVTPAKSDRLPKTQREIVKRLDQINFNSTLNAEIEALKGRDDLAKKTTSESYLMRFRKSGRNSRRNTPTILTRSIPGTHGDIRVNG